MNSCFTLGVLTYSTQWYVALLQHRGAVHFKSSVPQPQNSALRSTILARRCKLPSPSAILDILQSWLASIIALVYWGLLRLGVYSRGRYFYLLLATSFLCSLRSFLSIVRQRLRTLRRIAPIITKAKSGTKVQQKQRRVYMARKIASLAMDLTSVFSTTVLPTMVILIAGSMFNSLALATHGSVLAVIQALAFTVSNAFLHVRFNNARHKRAIALHSKQSRMQSDTEEITSNLASSVPQGMSALDESVVYN
jgi:hypothetical protein